MKKIMYTLNNARKVPVFILATIFLPLIKLHAQGGLTFNLIKNSYMNRVENDVPVGFSVLGNITLQAVHPYTKGFEGPYSPTPPPGAASDVNAASESSPYWFGEWNKGSRAGRGGLAGGWHSMEDGKILKITGNNQGEHSAVFFPFERNVLTNKVHLKAWVKIVSGNSVGFGNDAGYLTYMGGLVITKSTADAAEDGWYRIDHDIDISEMTSLDGLSFSMGVSGSSFEVYLALPHLSVVNTDSWLPSITDIVDRTGAFNVTASGDVGIGTTSPDSKLTVKGHIHTQEVKVDLQGAVTPDYVFEPDYDLPSLSEVQQYIQANKHLPEIPSAKEMDEKGLNLKEMNLLLLKKVEELTLYMLDQNQRIEQQQKEIDELKKYKTAKRRK